MRIEPACATGPQQHKRTLGGMNQSFYSKILADALRLVVNHVLRSCGELGEPLDNLIDGLDEVLLRNGLAARTNGKHASFGAHGADLGTSRVGAQACKQLKTDVFFAIDGTRVDFEYLSPAFQVGQPEFHFAVHAARAQQGRIKSVGAVGSHQHLNGVEEGFGTITNETCLP